MSTTIYDDFAVVGDLPTDKWYRHMPVPGLWDPAATVACSSGRLAVEARRLTLTRPDPHDNTPIRVGSHSHSLLRLRSGNFEIDGAAKELTFPLKIGAEGAKALHGSLVAELIIVKDGQEIKIVRDNMPFGRAGGEFGTYFLGYSRSPATIEEMLQNMFVGKPPGNYDRLLDFSRPVTGSLYFAPSATFLDSVAAD